MMNGASRAVAGYGFTLVQPSNALCGRSEFVS